MRFRQGTLRVLVATDLASRGIDVDGISHVINYDLPMEPEAYVHRIGRTGRAGADGIALSFCDSSERSNLRAIEKLVRRSIEVETDHPFQSSAAHQHSTARPAGRPNGQRRPSSNGHGGNSSSGGPRKNRRRFGQQQRRPAKAR